MRKRIAVVGASGRMGQSIVRILANDSEVCPAMSVEFQENSFLGKDIGLLAGIEPVGEILTDSREAAFNRCDAVIDFSTPVSTLESLSWAKRYKLPIVIGTTGFSTDQKNIIQEISREIPLLISPNMSLGVNALFKLVEQAAMLLTKYDYDLDIIEAHHRFKKDSPSGTALRLGEILVNVLLQQGKDGKLIYGRHGFADEKIRDEIAIHAVRGGDIVGDHTVSFMTLGERIEISHRAHNRDTFAKGAVAAIKFLLTKHAENQTGLFNMFDVLGL